VQVQRGRDKTSNGLPEGLHSYYGGHAVYWVDESGQHYFRATTLGAYVNISTNNSISGWGQ